VCDVCALLDCAVGFHFGEEVLVGVDSCWDFHSWLVVFGDFPDVGFDLCEWDLCACAVGESGSLVAHCLSSLGLFLGWLPISMAGMEGERTV